MGLAHGLDRRIAPLPAPRPLEGEEALETAAHALAALAAGIAAMQLLIAIVMGNALLAAFFAAALLATGSCAFVGEGRPWRRASFLAGGCASVIVWLSVLPGAAGSTAAVVIGMAGLSAVITRQLLADETEPSRDVTVVSAKTAPVGWIEDDLEGSLVA